MLILLLRARPLLHFNSLERLGGLPGTGSLVGYPVFGFASPATGDQGRLSWLILRPVRAVRKTRQDEAT
jgi:hypothetical protein